MCMHQNLPLTAIRLKKCAINLPILLPLLPECYKTQEVCVKFPLWFLILYLIDIRLKKCDKVVFNNFFMPKYCLGRYKSHEMYDKAVNDFLPPLKFVSSWFCYKEDD